MAERISAEAGSIARGAQQVVDTKESIDKIRQSVQNDVSAAKAKWQGSAASSYLQLMDRWDAEAKKVNAILLELDAALRATASDQAASEEEHQADIGRIAGLLG